MHIARAIRMGLVFAGLVGPLVAQDSAKGAYQGRRTDPLTYQGPAREDPDPTGISEVKFAYFGPADSEGSAATRSGKEPISPSRNDQGATKPGNAPHLI
jgi:hypothetical protein